MKIFLSGLALVLLSGFTTFQTSWSTATIEEVDAAHTKSATFYSSKKTYSMDITYSSYKGHDAVAPYETMNGYFRFDNGRSHSYIQGVHTIISGVYKMILDTVHKTMVVTDAPSENSNELMQINYANSKQYLTGCKKSESQLSTVYHMEFSEKVSYSAYELTFADNGQMKNITVFYRNEYPSDPQQPKSAKVKPKLKITYGPVTEKVTFSASTEFSLTKYFSESKGTLALTPAFKGFQLIDSRLKKK